MAAVLVSVAAVCGGCGGSGRVEKAAAPAPHRSSRCLPVPQSTVAAIGSGVHDARIGDAKAVRSRDYHKVFMVAATLEADGIHGETAVWATNSLADPHTVYSADETAAAFSDWGRLPGGSSADDGIYEARKCVTQGS